MQHNVNCAPCPCGRYQPITILTWTCSWSWHAPDPDMLLIVTCSWSLAHLSMTEPSQGWLNHDWITKERYQRRHLNCCCFFFDSRERAMTFMNSGQMEHWFYSKLPGQINIVAPVTVTLTLPIIIIKGVMEYSIFSSLLRNTSCRRQIT